MSQYIQRRSTEAMVLELKARELDVDFQVIAKKHGILLTDLMSGRRYH